MTDGTIDVEQLFLESSKAYDEQDIDKMMSFTTEDYTFFNVSSDGPQKLAENQEQAAKGASMTFQNPNYISGRATFTKAFGNIVVAFEIDKYREGDEVIEKGRVGLYEYRGDKMCRAWSFPVENLD